MGRAIAVAFAEAGAQVVVSDIAADGGQETVELITERRRRGPLHRRRRRRRPSVEALVRGTVDAFGGLHCAVNAAAIELEREPLADVEESTFDRIIAVNLKSIFLCMKYEIRQMLAQGDGRRDRQHRLDELVPAAAPPVGVHGEQARRARHDPNAAIDYAGRRASGSTPSARVRSTRRCCGRRSSGAAATRRRSPAG